MEPHCLQNQYVLLHDDPLLKLDMDFFLLFSHPAVLLPKHTKNQIEEDKPNSLA